MQKYTYIYQIPIDAMITDAVINDPERLLYKNIYLSLYCKGSKGLFKVCVWEGAGGRTELKYFDPKLMTVTLCLSCSLGLLNRRPRAHSAGCWFFLLHHISIFSGPQTQSGFPRAPSVVCGFPYHISPPTAWNSTGNSLARRIQLNYIIDRRHTIFEIECLIVIKRK